MKSSLFSLFVVLFACAIGATPARAQTGAASLTGIVTDQSGAAVPGATVTATNQATNVDYTAVSNEAGNYTMTSLPVGTYVVKAELAQLQDRGDQADPMEAKQIVRLDFKLELGGLEETVEVTSETPVLQTEIGDRRRGHLGHDADRRCRSTAATPASSRCCCRAS